MTIASIALALLAAGTTRYSGTFDTVQGNKVHMSLRDGSSGDWTLAPNAEFEFGSRRVTRRDLQPGGRGNVWVSEDGVIHKVQITSEPQSARSNAPHATPMWATHRGNVMWTSGKITWTKPWKGNQQFGIQGFEPNHNAVFTVEPGTKIYRITGAKPAPGARLEDLKVGTTVEYVTEKGKVLQVLIYEE